MKVVCIQPKLNYLMLKILLHTGTIKQRYTQAALKVHTTATPDVPRQDTNVPQEAAAPGGAYYTDPTTCARASVLCYRFAGATTSAVRHRGRKVCELIGHRKIMSRVWA
jgi:urease accessory protein UreH